MGEYLSPGVYVEEIDNSARSIEGIGTSTAGFIGFAEKGPIIGAPVLVTGFADFLTKFGGFLSEFEFGEYRYLANSVEQYFINGGTRCFVSRVAPADIETAQVKLGELVIKAANPGKWGNKIQANFSLVTKKKLQLVAKEGETYTAKNISGFKEGDIVTNGKQYNVIESIFDGIVTFADPFEEEVVDSSLIPKKVLYLVETDVQIRYEDQIETYSGLSFNQASPFFILNRMERSNIVKLSLENPNDGIANMVSIFGEEDNKASVVLTGGTDGTLAKVNAGTFIGEDNGPGKRSGIQSFLENNNVSIMAIPGVTIPEVVVALVAHCEQLKNRFAVLDMPKDMTKTQDLIEYRGMIDSSYAAMYHPWVQVYDRGTGKAGMVPPSGSVMGVYSRTDVQRGVHKAPANEQIVATGLAVNYTQAEQDILNPEGINLIRTLPGQGIRIWGARTASSNSNFKYVNVRRLFIFVEESIRANTNWVVFEPNDQNLWGRVQFSITTFLTDLWRAGMLAGATPAEAFFVEIGTTTMSRDDIANGKLICNIGISPSKPAEFVVFRVTQHTAESGGGAAEAAEE